MLHVPRGVEATVALPDSVGARVVVHILNPQVHTLPNGREVPGYLVTHDGETFTVPAWDVISYRASAA